MVFFKDVFIVNVGSPRPQEYMMGLIAIVMTLEATRRTMGPTLAFIGVSCIVYALLGPYMPGVLAHRGYNILRIINHLYVGTESVYGVAVGVVATYVFHFVLSGILAQMSGLGQFFIDLKTKLTTLDKIALTIGGLFLISPLWSRMAVGGALVLAVFWHNSRSAAFSATWPARETTDRVTRPQRVSP